MTVGTGFVKSSGTNDAVHHLVVAFEQTTALSGTANVSWLELFDVALTSGGPTGTVLDTYTGAVAAANTWYAFEFEVVINNSTGSWAIRKNGNTSNDHSLGSLDTQNSANAYANKLQLGCNSNSFSQWLDDLFWRSDASSVAWMGDIRCYTRMPASDASVQFSRTPTGVLTQTVPTSATSSTAMTGIATYTQIIAGYSGTVTGVNASVTATGTSVNMKCTIYADNGTGGAPGAILASATAPFTPVVVGSNTFTFSPGVTVVKGTTYWVGVCADGTGTYTTAASSAAQYVRSTTSYAAFPQASPVTTTPSLSAQIMWTYTATPANWQAVSEAQQDTTTSYVYDSTPGDADFYGVSIIPSTPVTTFAVVTRGYMQKSDAGTRTAAVQLKSGGTTVASPTLVLTTSGFLWAWRMDLTDPATGTAWTAAAVNNAQIGPTTVA
jgi:hypothetical protein